MTNSNNHTPSPSSKFQSTMPSSSNTTSHPATPPRPMPTIQPNTDNPFKTPRRITKKKNVPQTQIPERRSELAVPSSNRTAGNSQQHLTTYGRPVTNTPGKLPFQYFGTPSGRSSQPVNLFGATYERSYITGKGSGVTESFPVDRASSVTPAPPKSAAKPMSKSFPGIEIPNTPSRTDRVVSPPQSGFMSRIQKKYAKSMTQPHWADDVQRRVAIREIENKSSFGSFTSAKEEQAYNDEREKHRDAMRSSVTVDDEDDIVPSRFAPSITISTPLAMFNKKNGSANTSMALEASPSITPSSSKIAGKDGTDFPSYFTDKANNVRELIKSNKESKLAEAKALQKATLRKEAEERERIKRDKIMAGLDEENLVPTDVEDEDEDAEILQPESTVIATPEISFNQPQQQQSPQNAASPEENAPEVIDLSSDDDDVYEADAGASYEGDESAEEAGNTDVEVYADDDAEYIEDEGAEYEEPNSDIGEVNAVADVNITDPEDDHIEASRTYGLNDSFFERDTTILDQDQQDGEAQATEATFISDFVPENDELDGQDENHAEASQSVQTQRPVLIESDSEEEAEAQEEHVADAEATFISDFVPDRDELESVDSREQVPDYSDEEEAPEQQAITIESDDEDDEEEVQEQEDEPAEEDADVAPSHTIENEVHVHELSTIYEERTLEGISTIQEETTIREETTVEMTQTTQPTQPSQPSQLFSQASLGTATTSIQSSPDQQQQQQGWSFGFGSKLKQMLGINGAPAEASGTATDKEDDTDKDEPIEHAADVEDEDNDEPIEQAEDVEEENIEEEDNDEPIGLAEDVKNVIDAEVKKVINNELKAPWDDLDAVLYKDPSSTHDESTFLDSSIAGDNSEIGSVADGVENNDNEQQEEQEGYGQNWPTLDRELFPEQTDEEDEEQANEDEEEVSDEDPDDPTILPQSTAQNQPEPGNTTQTQENSQIDYSALDAIFYRGASPRIIENITKRPTVSKSEPVLAPRPAESAQKKTTFLPSDDEHENDVEGDTTQVDLTYDYESEDEVESVMDQHTEATTEPAAAAATTEIQEPEPMVHDSEEEDDVPTPRASTTVDDQIEEGHTAMDRSLFGASILPESIDDIMDEAPEQPTEQPEPMDEEPVGTVSVLEPVVAMSIEEEHQQDGNETTFQEGYTQLDRSLFGETIMQQDEDEDQDENERFMSVEPEEAPEAEVETPKPVENLTVTIEDVEDEDNAQEFMDASDSFDEPAEDVQIAEADVGIPETDVDTKADAEDVEITEAEVDTKADADVAEESEAEDEPQVMQTEPEVATEEAKPETDEMDLAATVEDVEDVDDFNTELKDAPTIKDAPEQTAEVDEPVPEIPEVKFDYATDVDSDGEDNEDDEPTGRSLSGSLYAPSVVDDGEPQQITEIEIEEVQELTATVTEEAEVEEMEDDVDDDDNEEDDEVDIIEIKMETTEEVTIESGEEVVVQTVVEEMVKETVAVHQEEQPESTEDAEAIEVDEPAQDAEAEDAEAIEIDEPAPVRPTRTPRAKRGAAAPAMTITDATPPVTTKKFPQTPKLARDLKGLGVPTGFSEMEVQSPRSLRARTRSVTPNESAEVPQPQPAKRKRGSASPASPTESEAGSDHDEPEAPEPEIAARETGRNTRRKISATPEPSSRLGVAQRSRASSLRATATPEPVSRTTRAAATPKRTTRATATPEPSATATTATAAAKKAPARSRAPAKAPAAKRGKATAKTPKKLPTVKEAPTPATGRKRKQVEEPEEESEKEESEKEESEKEEIKEAPPMKRTKRGGASAIPRATSTGPSATASRAASRATSKAPSVAPSVAPRTTRGASALPSRANSRAPSVAPSNRPSPAPSVASVASTTTGKKGKAAGTQPEPTRRSTRSTRARK